MSARKTETEQPPKGDSYEEFLEVRCCRLGTCRLSAGCLCRGKALALSLVEYMPQEMLDRFAKENGIEVTDGHV